LSYLSYLGVSGRRLPSFFTSVLWCERLLFFFLILAQQKFDAAWKDEDAVQEDDAIDDEDVEDVEGVTNNEDPETMGGSDSNEVIRQGKIRQETRGEGIRRGTRNKERPDKKIQSLWVLPCGCLILRCLASSCVLCCLGLACDCIVLPFLWSWDCLVLSCDCLVLCMSCDCFVV
jgi:hypothetical protein